MLKEFYYWAYTIYSKKKRFKGHETEYAYWVITSLLSLNYITLCMIVDYLYSVIWHFSFVEFLFKERGKSFESFLFMGILASPVFLYTYFQLDKKKKDIIRYYKEKKMSQFRQDWGKLFFWLYVVFTIVSTLWIAMLVRNMKIEARM